MKTLSYLFLILLLSCNASNGVKVLTSGISAPMLLDVSGQDGDNKTVDLGEHLQDGNPLLIPVTINNSSKYPYKNIQVAFSADAGRSASLKFAADMAGNFNFPGLNGTCKETLNPGESCTIMVDFYPRLSRRYTEYLTLTFTNLIEPETHTATITLISGTPASLSFTNDISQYSFGELVGSAQTPVVERSDGLTYTQDLEITNSGGLPAHNINPVINESCVSTLTNACPAGMSGAFTIASQCPSTLQPGDSCHMQVIFKPKNQDPVPGPTPDAIKEINYRTTIALNYSRDPSGSLGSLNAYFRSLSTNIQAKFKATSNTVNFDTAIISGNRDSRTFRITNFGYKHGQLTGFAFKDANGTLVGTCRAATLTSTQYLECRDALDNLVPLASLPFVIKDKNSCLTKTGDTPKLLEVGEGCGFDINFQPSVTFTSAKTTEFQNWQPEIIYDSQWRDVTTILNNKLFTLSAQSIPAARLMLTNVIYNGTTFTPVGAGPYAVDIGKQTLQASTFIKRNSMIFTFKNVGGVPATAISIKDGLNRTINVGGSGVNLGSTSPYYYASTLGSASTCVNIAPNATCTITSQFAPIGLGSPVQEDANMFDNTIAGTPYKQLFVTYATGSLYTDSNISAAADYPAQAAEARLTATLLRKGLLQPLAENTMNITPLGGALNTMGGDTSIVHVYLRNIGTGDIPYIRLLNPPAPVSPSFNWNYTIIPTASPSSLGADLDCYGLVDYDPTYTVSGTASPSTRIGNFAVLPVGKTCVLTFQAKLNDRFKNKNPVSCNDNATTANVTEIATRFFNRGVEAAGGQGLWEYCQSGVYLSMSAASMSFTYFDGDITDPLLPYGNKYTIPNYTLTVSQATSGKIAPYMPTSWYAGTVFRPGYTLPTLASTGKAGKVEPDSWMYGIGVNFLNAMNSATVSNFVQGDESRNFVPTLTAYTQKPNYDYIVYLGSFPQGSPTFRFTPNLRNFGNGRVSIKSFSKTGAAYSIVTQPASYPFFLNAGSDITPLTFDLSTATSGEQTLDVTITYEPGRHTQTMNYDSRTTLATNNTTAAKELLTLKVLYVANIMPAASYAYLTMQVEDYSVTQNNGAPPTVTIGAPYAATLSWGQNTPATNLVYDSIKIPGTPTANDVYAQKRITITNSSAKTISNLYFDYRTDINSSTLKTSLSSLTRVSGTCPTSASMISTPFSLAPGASCNWIVKYQPTSTDSSANFMMSFIYNQGSSNYTLQNVGVSLLPRSPGYLVASGLSLESINYKATAGSTSVTRSSYPLNYGTQNLDVVPKPMAFDQTTGTYKWLSIINQQGTKASLLLAYQMYVNNNSLRGYSVGSPAPNTLVPTAGEYRTVNGYEFAPIYLSKYGDGSTRLKVEASKGCFFGDDELNAGIPDFQKGFNSTTTTPCYLIPTLNLNFEYLLKTVSITDGDDMRDNSAEIWYYSVDRSASASFWTHIKGTVNPDTTLATGNFSNVEAFEDRTASFGVPALAENAPSVGTLAGFRVIMATTSAALNSPYSPGLTSFVDVRPYSPSNLLAAFDNTMGLQNGNYHYFRIVGIRKDNRFAYSATRFVGLNAGEYLSASTNAATNLSLVVPPVNHYYFHTDKLLVEKTLTGGVVYETFATSSGRCTSRLPLTIKNPSNVNLTYRLINKTAYNNLMSFPSATSYANWTKVAHWTSDSAITVDAACGGLPGFVVNTSSQDLSSSKVFYVRNSGNYSMPVNHVVGGVPGTNYSDYYSYIDPGVGFGSARCMVVLP